MIDLLGRRESLVEIRLALGVRPEHVPVVAICVHHAIELEDEPDELGLAFQHLVEAELVLRLRLMVRTIHAKIRLLVADILYLFYERLVDLDRPAILGLHHFKNFEFDEQIVGEVRPRGPFQKHLRALVFARIDNVRTRLII